MSLRFIFYILLVLLLSLYGILNYRRLRKPLKLLVVLVCCVFLSECLGRWFIRQSGSSIPAYHVLIVVQMILYPYIYLEALPPRKQLRRLILGFMIAGTAFSLFNSLFLQPVTVFPSHSVFLLSLFTVFLALLGFHFMLIEPVDRSPLKSPLFWFSLGNLFFYCITFFIFGFFTPFVRRSGGLPEWGFIAIFSANIFLYSCYFVALYQERKEQGSGY